MVSLGSGDEEVSLEEAEKKARDSVDDDATRFVEELGSDPEGAPSPPPAPAEEPADEPSTAPAPTDTGSIDVSRIDEPTPAPAPSPEPEPSPPPTHRSIDRSNLDAPEAEEPSPDIEGTQQTGPGPEGGPKTASGTPTRTSSTPPPAEPPSEPAPPAPTPEDVDRERVSTKPEPQEEDAGAPPGPEAGSGLTPGDAGLTGATAAEIERQLEAELGQDLTPGEDFVITRTDEGFRGELTGRFQEELAGGALEGRLESQFDRDLRLGEDFEVVRVGDGFQARLTSSFQEALATEDIEQQLEAELGRDVEPGRDFEVVRQNGGFAARLTGPFAAKLSREAAREAGIDLGAGPEDRQLDGPAIESGEFAVESDALRAASIQQRSELIEDVLMEAGPGFTAADVTVTRTDTGLTAQISPEAAEREAAEDLERQLEEQVGEDLTRGEDFEVVETETGFEARLTPAFEEQQARERLTQQVRADVGADLQLGEDFSIVRTEQGFQAQFTDEFFERQLESQIAAETGEQVDLTARDITVEDGRATLTEAGRKKVAVETAPLVGLSEGTPFEAVARAGAGAGFEFEQFGEQNRLRFFESVDEAVASGIEGLAGVKVRRRPADEFTTLGELAGDVGEAVAPPSGPILVRAGPEDEFRPIEAVGAEATAELAEAADRAFPGVDHPLVTRPIEAGEQVAADVGAAAQEAFPGADHPLVRDPIEATEQIAADADEFLSEFDAQASGTRLVAGAAAAAPVSVAEPTPAGELLVGGAALAGGALLAGGAAAEAIDDLPPEQKVAIGQAVAAVSQPGETLLQATEPGEFDPEDATVIGPGPTEVIIDPDTGQAEIELPEIEEGIAIFPPEEGALPPEQAPPELELPLEEAAKRESPRDVLTFPRDPPMAIQEDPIFLPEVLVPTAPKKQFTAGRFTPPEVPVETGEPTEPFGGPEVPIDEDFGGQERAEDFLFPGPEIPGVDDTFEGFPKPDTVVRAGEQETILERPSPEVVRDPADIARETGPGGPAFIKRSPSRVSDEFLLRTPTADIDLALVDPELARFLRQQEAAETAELDAFEGISERSPQRPADRVTPIGQNEQLTEALAGIRADSDLGFADALAPSLDDVTAQDTTPRMAERNVPRTTTTPRFATPTTPGTDVGPGFEFPGVEVTIDTPFVTTPGFGTPSGRGLRGLDPDLEQGQEEDELLDPDFFARTTEEEPGDPDAILTALDTDFGPKGFDNLTEGL